MNDGGKAVLTERRHQNMYVVRHDAPSMQAIALPIEVPQRASNELRDARLREETGAVPRIQSCFNALAPMS